MGEIGVDEFRTIIGHLIDPNYDQEAMCHEKEMLINAPQFLTLAFQFLNGQIELPEEYSNIFNIFATGISSIIISNKNQLTNFYKNNPSATPYPLMEAYYLQSNDRNSEYATIFYDINPEFVQHLREVIKSNESFSTDINLISKYACLISQPIYFSNSMPPEQLTEIFKLLSYLVSNQEFIKYSVPNLTGTLEFPVCSAISCLIISMWGHANTDTDQNYLNNPEFSLAPFYSILEFSKIIQLDQFWNVVANYIKFLSGFLVICKTDYENSEAKTQFLSNKVASIAENLINFTSYQLENNYKQNIDIFGRIANIFQTILVFLDLNVFLVPVVKLMIQMCIPYGYQEDIEDESFYENSFDTYLVNINSYDEDPKLSPAKVVADLLDLDTELPIWDILMEEALSPGVAFIIAAYVQQYFDDVHVNSAKQGEIKYKEAIQNYIEAYLKSEAPDGLPQELFYFYGLLLCTLTPLLGMEMDFPGDETENGSLEEKIYNSLRLRFFRFSILSGNQSFVTEEIAEFVLQCTFENTTYLREANNTITAILNANPDIVSEHLIELINHEFLGIIEFLEAIPGTSGAEFENDFAGMLTQVTQILEIGAQDPDFQNFFIEKYPGIISLANLKDVVPPELYNMPLILSDYRPDYYLNHILTLIDNDQSYFIADTLIPFVEKIYTNPSLLSPELARNFVIQAFQKLLEKSVSDNVVGEIDLLTIIHTIIAIMFNMNVIDKELLQELFKFNVKLFTKSTGDMLNSLCYSLIFAAMVVRYGLRLHPPFIDYFINRFSQVYIQGDFNRAILGTALTSLSEISDHRREETRQLGIAVLANGIPINPEIEEFDFNNGIFAEFLEKIPRFNPSTFAKSEDTTNEDE